MSEELDERDVKATEPEATELEATEPEEEMPEEEMPEEEMPEEEMPEEEMPEEIQECFGRLYDYMNLDCVECEYKERCEKEFKNKDKKITKDIEEIKNKVSENFSTAEAEMLTFRGCMGVIRRFMGAYHKEGLNKRKGYKERIKEVREEVKQIGKLPAIDDKLSFLIDCAEYVFFG